MITLFFRQKREGVNSIEMVFDNLDSSLSTHRNLCVPKIGASPVTIMKNILFAFRNRDKVNHITGDVQYLAIGTGRNTILTVHDVGSTIYGAWYKQLALKMLLFWIPSLIVKKITVISESTKSELIQVIPWAKKKIVVIPNAFNPLIEYRDYCMNKSCPTILHMGTNFNKNLERVILALSKINCKLIIVGKLTPAQIKALKINSINYQNYYDIEYADIIRLYHSCDIVSFPSTYEGFGVPILEANAAGRPILVGDIPVLHEVGGNAAFYVDPLDTNSIREGFIKLINDENLRCDLISNGLLNIKRFSPQVVAAKYNDVYNSFLKK